MAFSARVETFTVASLPAWMTDGSTGTGSAVVSGGVLTLTAGDGSGQQGLVNSAATDQLDSFYCRMYPLPSEPLAVAMNFFDASFDGYGLGVGTSSNTPGDAELRVNKLVAGSLSHPDSESYNSTNHRWFRMRIDSTLIRFETAPDSGTDAGSWTEAYNVAFGSDLAGWDKDNSTLWLYCDPNTVDAYGNVAVIDGINGPTEAPSVTVEQEGFRWRNDDGSESAATWKASQDTDITEAAGVARLRVLLNGDGDPAAATYQLEYSRNGRPYAKVGEAPFPAFAAAPTPSSFDSNATDHAVAMPATVAAGDLLVVLFSNDGSATVTNPDAGKWRELFSDPNSTNNRLSGYAAVAAGTEGGTTVNFVTSTGERAAAQVYRVTAALWTGDTDDLIVGTSATGTDAAPNPPSATPDATRDWLAIACYGADDDDDASAYPTDYGTHQTYTQSGSGTEAASLGSASRTLRSGSAFNPGTFTIAATEQWVAQTILIPPTAVAVELEASANIAGSAATSTTAQLTAPSGKTTGDFVAGRISDDTNPLPSLNITTDDYLEAEWSIDVLASVVVAADVIDFRVTDAGTPLDTYTETPSWTIAAGDIEEPVGQASTTDTALAITARKALAIGQASATDTALAAAARHQHTTGLPATTDTALAIGSIKYAATGLPAETDSGLAVAAQRRYPAGIAAATDTALAVTPAKRLATGLAAETDTGLALIAGGTAVDQAAETDTALTVTAQKAAAAGLSSESDTALAATPAKVLALGLASETDAGLSIASVGTAVGRPSETDAALAPTAAKRRTTGLAATTSSALAMTSRKVMAVGLASETDTGLGAAAGHAVAVGLAAETDTTFAVAITKRAAVGQALEADAAFALGSALSGTTGLGEEADTAFAMGRRKVLAVGLASTTANGFGVTVQRIRAIGLATETETGLAAPPAKAAALGLPATTASAFSLTLYKRAAVGVAIETDSGFSVIDGSLPTYGPSRFGGVGLATPVMVSVTVVGARLRDVALDPE